MGRFSDMIRLDNDETPPAPVKKKKTGLDVDSILDKNDAVRSLAEKLAGKSEEQLPTEDDPSVEHQTLPALPQTDAIIDIREAEVVKPPVEPPVKTVVKPVVKIEQVVKPPVEPPVKTVANSVAKPVVKPEANFFHNDWRPLIEKQGKILLFLIQAGGSTKRQAIVDSTGINLPSVKYNLSILVKEGFITSTTQINTHNYQGFSYSLNEEKCFEYFIKFNPPEEWPSTWSLPSAARAVVKQVDKPAVKSVVKNLSPSSSLLESKPTTANFQNEQLWKTPELAYWWEKGLTYQQIFNWMEEFQTDELLLVEALKYCRFEMVDLGYEESKNIRSVTSWFYRIMQRTGTYPRPDGYASLAERQTELRQKILEERIAERNRLQQLEFEEKFQDMLDNPDGELYQRCMGAINENFRDSKGKVFESALRQAFSKIAGIEPSHD